MIALLLIILKTLTFSYADDEEICKYFKYCGSNGPRASAKSLPSASIASSFNPGNISKVKGIGLETIYLPSNPLGYSLVTGNGKLGGALISSSGENSFFGNRSIEIDELYLQRRIEDQRYRNKKLHIAAGFAILDKRDFGLELGLSAKRNPDIKKINPGVALSGRFHFLNFGYYTYKDDIKLDIGGFINPYNGQLYSNYYGADTYQESFNVRTLTFGTKIKKLAIDVGIIKTKYDFYEKETSVRIISASIMQDKFLFNLAYRTEESDNLKEKDGYLFIERNKNDVYGGVQYFINKHFIIGLSYNNFLLNEVSGNLTLFL